MFHDYCCKLCIRGLSTSCWRGCCTFNSAILGHSQARAAAVNVLVNKQGDEMSPTCRLLSLLCSSAMVTCIESWALAVDKVASHLLAFPELITSLIILTYVL